MLPLFEKFPPLVKNGKRLVWDSRQEATNGPECIVIADTEGAAEAEPDTLIPSSKNSEEVEISRRLRERRALHPDSELVMLDDPLSDFLANAAIAQWGTATRILKVFGVTGTNGKSTSVAILRHLLTRNNLSCAEIGTLGVSFWKANAAQPAHFEETGFTTPEAHQLHFLFHRLLEEGCQSVAIEVSSHAIELRRIAGVRFAGGVFTNLTQDHLDFHKTMQNYEAAKLKFFTDILTLDSLLGTRSVAVVNEQSDVGQRYLEALRGEPVKVVSFSRPKTYEILESSDRGLRVKWADKESFRTSLVGDFNAENVMGCLELVHASLGVPRAQLSQQMESFSGVSGRLERVTEIDSPIHAFVDYAHTPDALEKALLALGNVLGKNARLFCVFGCGGDRDASKRPKMGAIAAHLASEVVVTSDNPRTEAPEQIIAQILAGVSDSDRSRVTSEPDRKSAIVGCLKRMKPGDILLVAGKGHEQYQIVGKQKLPFSDQDVVKKFCSAPRLEF